MSDEERLQIVAVPDQRLLVQLHLSHRPHPSTPAIDMCDCQWGAQSIRATVFYSQSLAKDKIVMSSALLNQLNLSPHVDHVRARVLSNRVEIGPVIGILANPRWNPKQNRLRPTSQSAALVKLAQVALDAGVFCYLFRAEDVDFAKGMVQGYVLRGGKFVKARLPMPDVIYDQLISRRVERTDAHQGLRARLSRLYGSRIFNDGFFDKWQVHEWLSKDTRLRKHLPTTTKYRRVSDAATFVERRTSTFLKPIHGSLGLGIVRLTRQVDGSVVYEIKRPAKSPIRGTAKNCSQAISIFKSRLGSQPYLLQEGVSLATYHNRPFDIRILMQRDTGGVWKRTKMFARVAKEGDFTSNLSSGGEALPVPQVLSEVYGSQTQRRRCLNEIKRVSRLIADSLEQQSGKVFGELGIDIGVDMGGGVWVIEVNSKPWKAPVTEKGRQDLTDLAYERPIRYALWLAENKKAGI